MSYGGLKKFSDINTDLEMNAYIVIFTKRDGSLRVMLCTRNTAMASSYHPGIRIALESRDIKASDEVCVVVDMEVVNIRAFKKANVVYCEFAGNLRNKGVYERAKSRVKHLRELWDGKLKEYTESERG